VALVSLSDQLVRLGRHDKVIKVQALDDMRPPANRYFSPLGEDRGVVACRFRDRAHLMGKSYRVGKIAECKLSAQSTDTLLLDQLPIGNFSQ